MGMIKSLYRQTVGNPYIRGIAVGALYGDLSRAKSSGHKRYIENELNALGEGDFINGYDSGEPPKGE